MQVTCIKPKKSAAYKVNNNYSMSKTMADKCSILYTTWQIPLTSHLGNIIHRKHLVILMYEKLDLTTGSVVGNRNHYVQEWQHCAMHETGFLLPGMKYNITWNIKHTWWHR